MTVRKKILILILSAIFVMTSSLGITSVWAKYVSESGGSGTISNNGYDLDYGITRKVVVNSQEELISALKNGYSYIQLSDSLKDPFIITEATADVKRSLILDLNGKEIQRVSSEPMLTVTAGVTLTIIDSSDTQYGGLYNPIGSVLDVKGGNLVVSAGTFESGPRNEGYIPDYSFMSTEYYSEDSSRINSSDEYKNGVLVTVYYSATDENVKEEKKQYMPVFSPQLLPKKTDDSQTSVPQYVSGNVYFDKAWTGKVDVTETDDDGNETTTSITSTIPIDTYCYFVTSDGFTSGDTVNFDATTADFSYSYYANPANSSTPYQFISADIDGLKSELGKDAPVLNTDYVKITIYGFYDDMQTASNDETHYAAVLMEDGTLTIDEDPEKNNSFNSYFGVDDAYCVYATGGNMTINNGAFMSEGYSTCLGCNFKDTKDIYGTLTVNDGEFTSYLGDAIRVSGFAQTEDDVNDMTVNGGSFTKIADQKITVWKTDEDGSGSFEEETPGIYYDANGSAINMMSGRLTVTGKSENSQEDLIKFTLYGGGVNGIKCGAGAQVSCTDTEFLFNCDYTGTAASSSSLSTSSDESTESASKVDLEKFSHNIGILNYEGTVSVQNNLFRLNTAYSVGIYSVGNGFFNTGYTFSSDTSNGSVTAVSTIFSMTGASNVGVLATRGTVTLGSEDNLGTEGEDRYAVFYIDHVVDCFGVYVAGVQGIDKDGKEDENAAYKSPERGKVDLSGDDNQLQTEANVVSYAAQFFMGQKYYNDSVESKPPENSYYTSENVGTNSRIFNGCGIYLNGKDADSKITLYRTMLFSAGSYTAGIFVRNGTVEQGKLGSNVYKYASLMGVTVNKYLAGGQYDTSDSAGDHSSANVAGHFRNKFGLTWYVAQYGADNYTSEQIFDVSQANAKACQGLITFGGDIKLYKCFLGIYSTWSNGIYSSGGTVDIIGYDTSGNGKSDEGFECKLITLGATSTDASTAKADIAANTNISSPYSYSKDYTDEKIEGDRLITSCVVRMYVTGTTTTGTSTTSSTYSDTESSGSATDTSNRVYIAAGKITTDNYGFYIEGGNLFFGSYQTLGVTQITGYRAPAIVLKGGSVTVYKDDSLIINDTLNTSLSYIDADGSTQTFTGDPEYKDFTSSGTIVTDAVYVSGGNFTANGTLDIEFTGLANDVTYTYYTSEVIKSYAVGVYSGDFKANASTSKLKVIANTGGGVKAQGGTVILGNESVSDGNLNTKNGNIVVIAKSLNPSDGKYTLGEVNSHTLTNTNITTYTWQSYYNLYGGHALQVRGGDVTVYYGYYEAYYGNGLSVYSSSDTSATVKVYDGTFYGWQSGTYDGDKDEFTSAVPYIYINGEGKRLCGPASYCGLRVIGNVDMYVYGGTFDGGNGGASVSGRLSPGSTDCKTANVYLYAGTFGNTDSPTSQDGFCSYEYSNVVFGAYTRAELTEKYGNVNTKDFADSLKNLLKIYALGCAIAYSPMSSTGNGYDVWVDTSTSTMAVYYGTYYATNGDTGIANNSIFKIYNMALTSNMYTTLIKYNDNKGTGTITKMSNSFALFYKDNFYQYAGNSNNSDTITQTTNDDGTSYYANEYIKYEFTNASFASDWAQGSKLGTTTGTNATVKITCLADYLEFNANFGIWDSSAKSGVTDSTVISDVTVEVYSSDGTLKQTVTVGYGYESLTKDIILNKGDYILITANFSNTNYKVDLESITYEGYIGLTADVIDEYKQLISNEAVTKVETETETETETA